jgi:PleD family two-component response regulator
MTEADILNAKILIIDDAEANLKLLEDLLAREGFHQIISTADSTRALDLFKAFEPDLVLLVLILYH